ncbi:MAG TPA: hypothetical protein VG273_28850 [Bryobacteraceae bacterium]|jgi:hypothetical protein|nr:hypothetical protein [Bryobacteraceae bacterium]
MDWGIVTVCGGIATLQPQIGVNRNYDTINFIFNVGLIPMGLLILWQGYKRGRK